MIEETEMTAKPALADSAWGGISIRAWLAIALVLTVCVSHTAIVTATVIDAARTGNFDKVGTLTTIGEPLYSLAIAAVSYYFGNAAGKRSAT